MDHPPRAGLDERTAPSWTVPSADGVEIAAYELGGEGPPLLVAHATGFLGPVYGPMAEGLADRFRVVALDFRGHGASTRPANDDFGWDRMALDLLAVVDHLGGGPIAGFGHSLGGGVALLAERQRPCTFASLFLFEPIVFPDDMVFDGPNRMAGPARSRRSSFPSRADALARYSSRPPLSLMRPDVLAIYVRDGFVDQADGSVALACSPDDEARTFESEIKVRTSTIAAVDTDVTVTVGHDEEGPNPARLGAAIVAALPRAELLVHPELGHLGPFEDPPAVAALVRDHL
jgi:pimeloyl-ACP methyl ester carboxylesterase